MDQACREMPIQNLGVEDTWKIRREIFVEANKEILGDKQNTKKKVWFDTDYHRLNGETSEARIKMLQNPSDENRNKFHNLRNKIRKLTRKKG